MKDNILVLVSSAKDTTLVLVSTAKDTTLVLVSSAKDTILAIATYVKEHGLKNLKDAGKAYHYVLAFLLINMGWGLWSWIRIMFIDGVGITGSSDLVPWGVYIIVFVFAVGTSAGASLMGLMIYGFGRHDYHPIGTRAIIVGLCSLMVAVLCLVSDVGNPIRAALLPAVLRNMTSALVLTSMSYALFASVMLVELYFALKITLQRGKGSRWDEMMAKVSAVGALCFALIVVHAPHGALFAVLKARHSWNTALLPPHFVVVALASGVALMIFISITTAKLSKRELVSEKTLANMGTLLAFFLGGTLFMDFFDFVVMNYAGSPGGLHTWHYLTGRFLPLFLVNIIGMATAMVMMFFKRGRTVNGLLIASILTIMAIIAYRTNLVMIAQVPALFPGIGEIEYIPTTPEMAVVAGIVGGAIFLYLVLTKLLPMEETIQAINK